jgi:PAS domain S-box-containing protein
MAESEPSWRPIYWNPTGMSNCTVAVSMISGNWTGVLTRFGLFEMLHVGLRSIQQSHAPAGTHTMETYLPMGLEGDILKSLRIPLAVIDNEFRYLWLNREMAWIYQTQPERIAGKVCYELIARQDGPCKDCPVAAVHKSGRREISQKYKDFPDGRRKYGEVSAFPIYDTQKKIVATLMMVIDITDKVVFDMDLAHQMLTRLMPSLQESEQQPLHPPTSAAENGGRDRNRAGKNDLTHRETQVLRLLTKGYSNTRIASGLHISPHTVKSHVINIFNKLGVNDRIQAAVVATKRQIIE